MTQRFLFPTHMAEAASVSRHRHHLDHHHRHRDDRWKGLKTTGNPIRIPPQTELIFVTMEYGCSNRRRGSKHVRWKKVYAYKSIGMGFRCKLRGGSDGMEVCHCDEQLMDRFYCEGKIAAQLQSKSNLNSIQIRCKLC